uniref:Sof1-like protein domain-containing protein n=1 Tax=Leersia perrieri TaxID=77586 RepID=A0A0D9WRR7_9ORYZ
MRGGADSARRRDGRAAEDEEEEEEEEEEDADLAGAARRREADERSSDLAAAAAIVGWIPLRWGEVSSPPVRLVVSPDRVAEFPASPSPPAAPLAGMRVKVVSRSTDEFTRERSQDLQKVFRNYDPALRTQEKAVEYTRALNAAKLEKIFARPFIGAMDGHVDDVSCMAKNPNYLKAIFSGSMDGVFDYGKSLCSKWDVDYQWDGNLFATVGAQVDIWDQNRSEPINSFEWGKDTVLSVRFNPGEPDTRCNSICWNPREPMNFTAANEDTNCYSFDARKLDEAKVVHKGHVRLFQYNGDHSREIYHTKRMQRVFCVKYTYDGTYLVSGSDDTNLRLWKSKASEQLGVLLPRERRKQEYLDAVKERYKHLPEVKRIVRHRHLPKPIYKAGSLRRTMVEAENRKEVGGHTVPL